MILRKIRITLFIILFLLMLIYSHAPGGRPFCHYSGEKLYHPQHAEGSGKAIWIKYKLSQYVLHPAYQKRKGITFCNVFARDVLDPTEKETPRYCFFFNDFKYDLSPVFPKVNSIYMNIPRAYHKAIKAEKKEFIISWSAREAQDRANNGKLIWGVSKKYNHEFLVCMGKWDEKKGCKVAQAGEKNGIFYIGDKEVFGKNWKDPEIRFYEFKEIK